MFSDNTLRNSSKEDRLFLQGSSVKSSTLARPEFTPLHQYKSAMCDLYQGSLLILCMAGSTSCSLLFVDVELRYYEYHTSGSVNGKSLQTSEERRKKHCIAVNSILIFSDV